MSNTFRLIALNFLHNLALCNSYDTKIDTRPTRLVIDKQRLSMRARFYILCQIMRYVSSSVSNILTPCSKLDHIHADIIGVLFSSQASDI
jgi:hypothetical protein